MSGRDQTVYEGPGLPGGDRTVYEGSGTPGEGRTVYEGPGAPGADGTVYERGRKPEAGTAREERNNAAGGRPGKNGKEQPSGNRAGEPSPGDILLDTYKVQTLPVRGGMGSVWRVRHQNWNIDLAMKLPRPELFESTEQKDAFSRECEAWINLGLHPNIVSCYYVRQVKGIPAIFSEWMENGSLENRIQDRSLYTGSEATRQERLLDIAVQFARGLRYAHEEGLIHQDVKPDNLLLTKAWEAKVSDFGLAGARAQLTVPEGEKILTENNPGATVTAPSGGYTPAYCSLEQMDGKKLTRRTDIYSWAVSVMEMFLGERPWTNGVVAGLNCGDYLAQSRVPVPPELRTLLTACMAADPEERPHDFGSVEEELLEIYRKVTGKAYPRPKPRAAMNTAGTLNNRALSFLDLGKEQEAVRLLEQAQALDHVSIPVNMNLLLTLWRTGRINDREMLSRCSLLKASAPDREEFDLAMAGIYLENGQYPEATELLNLLMDSHASDRQFDEYLECACSFSPQQTTENCRDEEAVIGPKWRRSPDLSASVSAGPNDCIMLYNEKLHPRMRNMRLEACARPGDCMFSPDGQHLMTINYKTKELQAWDTRTGKTVKRLVYRLAAAETFQEWKYSGAGRYLVLTSSEGIFIFTVRDKYALYAHLTPEGTPLCAAVSRDGKTAAAGFGDGTVATFRLPGGERLADYRIGTEAIRETELSPVNGLGAACSMNMVCLWKLQNGQCLHSVQDAEKRLPDLFRRVHFSPDGKFLIWRTVDPNDKYTSAGEETTMRIPDFSFRAPYMLSRIQETRQQLENTDLLDSMLARLENLWNNEAYSLYASLLEDARKLPGVEHDPRLLKMNERLSLHGQPESVRACWPEDNLRTGNSKPDKFEASDTGVIVMSRKTAPRSRDTDLLVLRPGDAEPVLLGTFTHQRIDSLQITRDGKTAMSVSQYDSINIATVILWDPETEEQTGKVSIETIGPFGIHNAVLSPDGRYFAMATVRKLGIYRTNPVQAVREWDYPDVKGLAFDGSGRKLLAYRSGTLYVFDRFADAPERELAVHSYSSVLSVSPDSECFVIEHTEEKTETSVFSLSTGALLCGTEIRNHRNDAHFIGNSRLYWADGCIWDTRTGEKTYEFRHMGEADEWSLRLSPDGRHAYTARADGSLGRWYVDYRYRVE